MSKYTLWHFCQVRDCRTDGERTRVFSAAPFCPSHTCTVLNGTYACSLAQGHDGSHLTAPMSGRRFRFADKYAAVVPA